MSRSNKTNEQPRLSSDLLPLLCVLAAVLALWGFGWWWVDAYVHGAAVATETAAQARGLFGDKFGAVNALFSGLAFAGIIFTILLQRRDLAQTRLAFEEQTRATDHQSFESTFFKLLSLHNEITANLTDLGNEGRQAFNSFNERVKISDDDFPVFKALSKLKQEQICVIKDNRTIDKKDYPDLTDADIGNIETSLRAGTSGCELHLSPQLDMHKRKIVAAYTKAAVIHIDNYSHYFRNLYHILLFIDQSIQITEIERFRYAKFVRSQLSELELVALFYNSIARIDIPGREGMELGYPKMGRLLTKYRMLENMSPLSAIHPTHHQIFAESYK